MKIVKAGVYNIGKNWMEDQHKAPHNSMDNPETDLLVNGLGTLKVLQYVRIS